MRRVCLFLLLAAGMSSLVVAGEALAQETTTAAAIGPQASEGGRLDLAFESGVGTLAGPLGVSAALLPIRRLALGAVLGSDSHQMLGGTERDLRFGVFARGYFIDRPRLRAFVAVAAASVD